MSLYEQNLSQLEARFPEVASRIASLSPCDVEPTKDGNLTYRFSDGSLAHSAYRPVDEAARYVDGIYTKDGGGFFLLGLGLGWAAINLASRTDELQPMFLVEPDVATFRAAMEHVDWSPVWQRGAVHLHVGSDPLLYRNWVRSALHAQYVPDLLVTELPSFAQKYKSLFDTYRDVVIAEMATWRTELFTLKSYGKLLDMNRIRNLPSVSGAIGVESLKDCWAGRPAVVVGAGPGLDDHLDALQSLRDDLLVVAAGKAGQVLTTAGVGADLLVHIDPHEPSRTVYQDDAVFQVPMLMDPDACPGLSQAFKGPLLTTFEEGATPPEWLEKIGNKGLLPKGLSVTHTALAAARHFGADPVYLVGIDLAFPGRRTHAEGAVPTWGAAVNFDNPSLVEVPSVDGGQVLTTPSMRSFVTFFEGLIERMGGRIVNCSHGGALIRGAEAGSLPATIDVAGPSFETCLEDVSDTPDEDRAGPILEDLAGHLEEMVLCAQSGLDAIEGAWVSGGSKAAERINRCRAQMLAAEEKISLYLKRAQVKVYMDLTDLRLRQRKEGHSDRGELVIARTLFAGYRDLASEMLDVVRDVLGELS